MMLRGSSAIFPGSSLGSHLAQVGYAENQITTSSTIRMKLTTCQYSGSGSTEVECYPPKSLGKTPDNDSARKLLIRSYA
jgi:hypothetical protein